MKIFGAPISYPTFSWFQENFENVFEFEAANQKIKFDFKILNFFTSNNELFAFKTAVNEHSNIVEEPDRTEYGDFQTNERLANQIARFLAIEKSVNPELIIEPTCGKGNFIIACLNNIIGINKIIGIEIYEPYVWETKFKLIHYFLENPLNIKPEVEIFNKSIFHFPFQTIAQQFSESKILIIGNPPWVTNAQLGALNSENLPAKANFKNQKGFDALTGKGNFDIAEYILLKLIDEFKETNTHFAFLVKNTVIKNIVYEQNKNQFNLSNFENYRIDSKKEFNVSVESSLFLYQLNNEVENFCNEYDFYQPNLSTVIWGWTAGKFVSNIERYRSVSKMDGRCPFEWRQGLKHDCSSVMEFERINGYYVNGLNEKVELEKDLVYGILKSSDLKNLIIDTSRKYTVVTQRKIGQETDYIEQKYPKTYRYLKEHSDYFTTRKSTIYEGKPPFSIFGVGDYSFEPYKVAISGLYKTFHFTLIFPDNEKTVMLDDTCYFIGFDQLEYAIYTYVLLNSEMNKKFLESITFADAKRMFTKEVLMRIDISCLAKTIEKDDLLFEINKLNKIKQLNVNFEYWENYLKLIQPVEQSQKVLF